MRTVTKNYELEVRLIFARDGVFGEKAETQSAKFDFSR